MSTENLNPDDLKDRYQLTYLLFYVLGTLTLLPTNFFTTATDYWMYKFRNPSRETWTDNNRSDLQKDFTSTFSIVSSVTQVVLVVFSIRLYARIAPLKRVIGSLVGLIICYLLMVIFVEINTDSWQHTFFIMTMVIGGLVAACCAVFMVAIFGTAQKFPSDYFAAILTGQAICAIVSALVQIFSLGVGAGHQTSGLIYFLIGMVLIIFVFGSFMFQLKTSDFFNYHFFKERDMSQVQQISRKDFGLVALKIKDYLLSIILITGSTSLVHPSLTSLVVSVDEGNGDQWNDLFFQPVCTFLFYNLFDFIGRELAQKFPLPIPRLVILVISTLRVGFVPMLMYCNVQPRNHLDVYFDQDVDYIVFIIIFGFTNGYLLNTCLAQVPTPKVTTTPKERVLASLLLVMTMLISMGIFSLLNQTIVNAV